MCASAALLAANSGCGFNMFGPTRTSDGGGGSVLSAGVKAASGQLTQLTQDEVQLLSDQLRAFLAGEGQGGTFPPMTNEQADAFLEFLSVNTVPGSDRPGLNSLEELQAFLDAAAVNPGIIIIPQSLIDAYGLESDDFNLEAFLNSVVGGVSEPDTTAAGGNAESDLVLCHFAVLG
jgi:hypothetical protein